MIAFFPELYEDELAYSWFSRYYTKSGYLSLRYALDDLYVKRYVNPDTEFVNELRPEVKELVIKHCGMEKLIPCFPLMGDFCRMRRSRRLTGHCWT